MTIEIGVRNVVWWDVFMEVYCDDCVREVGQRVRGASFKAAVMGALEV